MFKSRLLFSEGPRESLRKYVQLERLKKMLCFLIDMQYNNVFFMSNEAIIKPLNYLVIFVVGLCTKEALFESKGQEKRSFFVQL